MNNKFVVLYQDYLQSETTMFCLGKFVVLYQNSIQSEIT